MNTSSLRWRESPSDWVPISLANAAALTSFLARCSAHEIDVVRARLNQLQDLADTLAPSEASALLTRIVAVRMALIEDRQRLSLNG